MFVSVKKATDLLDLDYIYVMRKLKHPRHPLDVAQYRKNNGVLMVDLNRLKELTKDWMRLTEERALDREWREQQREQQLRNIDAEMSAYDTFMECFIRLRELVRQEADESFEGEELRDKMDNLWPKLSNRRQHEISRQVKIPSGGWAVFMPERKTKRVDTTLKPVDNQLDGQKPIAGSTSGNP